MVVGITGGIGSGKTTIVKMFAEFKNTATYFADKEAKILMNSSLVIKEKLIKEFSEEVFLDGLLNRKFLAGIVFSDKEKLKTLNSIVHPVVHQHLQDFILVNKDKNYIIYENAILFEKGSDVLCDKVITVVAPLDVKIQRVIARDKTSREEVVSRMDNQWLDGKKTLQSHYVIDNITLINSKNQVLDIHNKLTKR